MKTAILVLSSLLLSIPTLTSLAYDDSETNIDQNFEIDEQFDYSDRGLEKNIITNIFNSVFSKILPTLGDINITRLDLGEKIGSLANVHVLGVNETQIGALEEEGYLSIKNLTLVLDQITVTGSYDFISLTLPGPISLFGQGDFLIELQNFTLSTGVTIRMGAQDLIVSDLPNLYLYLNHATLNFENLMGNEPVGDLLNSIISDALPKLIEAIYPELVKPPISIVIMDLLAAFLNCAKNHILNVNYCLTSHELDFQLPEINIFE